MIRSTFVLIFLALTISIGAAQSSVSVQYPQVTLTAPAAGGTGIASVNAGQVTAGFQPRDAKLPGKTVIMQILDGTSDRVIKDITIDEYFGNENDSWKLLPERSSNSASKSTSAFAVKVRRASFTLTREIEQVSDEHFPSGKGMKLRFAVESASAMKVRFRLNGLTTDSLYTKGASFTLEGTGTPASGIPAMVGTLSNAQKVVVERGKKKEPFSLTATTNAVSVSPGSKTTIAELTLGGALLRERRKAIKLAGNLESFFIGKKKAVPELIASTVPDKKSAMQGDTVTYTIYYQNIGTSAAAEIEVHNPVAPGSEYLQGSASGEGSEISFAHQKDDESKPVTKINWKFRDPIYPGQERAVKFSVVVK